MALINCPECNRSEVSDSSEACPGCGFNLNKLYKKKEKDKVIVATKRKISKILTVFMILLSFVFLLFFFVVPLENCPMAATRHSQSGFIIRPCTNRITGYQSSTTGRCSDCQNNRTTQFR
jgi:hypothetical protein